MLPLIIFWDKHFSEGLDSPFAIKTSGIDERTYLFTFFPVRQTLPIIFCTPCWKPGQSVRGAAPSVPGICICNVPALRPDFFPMVFFLYDDTSYFGYLAFCWKRLKRKNVREFCLSLTGGSDKNASDSLCCLTGSARTCRSGNLCWEAMESEKIVAGYLFWAWTMGSFGWCYPGVSVSQYHWCWWFLVDDWKELFGLVKLLLMFFGGVSEWILSELTGSTFVVFWVNGSGNPSECCDCLIVTESFPALVRNVKKNRFLCIAS